MMKRNDPRIHFEANQRPAVRLATLALVIAALSLILAACAPATAPAVSTPAATQAPTPQPTEKPAAAATTAPAATATTAPVAAEKPVATATSAPTAAAVQAPAAGQAAAVSFKNDVLPIMEKSCVKCHGGDKTEARLSLKDYAGIMAGSENGPVVKPGDAANSDFVTLVAQGKMPKRASRLPDAQIKILTDWVNAGAPNN